MSPPETLYLHGFNSSPASTKAQQLYAYYRDNGWEDSIYIPALSFDPKMAIYQLGCIMNDMDADQRRNLLVIGSSLGGFYATYLAEHYGCKAVLINPAVDPHLLLKENLGVHQNYYTDEVCELTLAHLDTLIELNVDVTQFERYRVYLQTGDETLDYRQAEQKYVQSELIIEEGGNHGFQHFERIIPDILGFAGFPA